MQRFLGLDLEIDYKTPEACARLTKHLQMQRVLGKGQQGVVRVYKNEVVKIIPLNRKSKLSPSLSQSAYEVACLRHLSGTKISADFHGAWICTDAQARLTMYIQMEKIPDAVSLFHYLQTHGEDFKLHDLRTLVHNVFTMNTVHGIVNTDLDLHNIIVVHARGVLSRIVVIDFGLAYQARDPRYGVKDDMDMLFLWYAFTKLVYEPGTPRALAISPGKLVIPKKDINSLFVTYLQKYAGNGRKGERDLRRKWTTDSRIRSLRDEKKAYGQMIASAHGLLFASVYQH